MQKFQFLFGCHTNATFMLHLPFFKYFVFFKFILLDKKDFLNSYKDNCLFIITSNNQELIHHIHCFGCIFYHQSKTKKSCWYYKFLSYNLSFESYSLNVSIISYSRKHLYVRYDLFLLQHFCLCPLPFYSHYYHLPNTGTSLVLIRQILQS